MNRMDEPSYLVLLKNGVLLGSPSWILFELDAPSVTCPDTDANGCDDGGDGNE